jgi:hypothetical protein
MKIVLLFALPTWMLFGGYAAFVVFSGIIAVQILCEYRATTGVSVSRSEIGSAASILP